MPEPTSITVKQLAAKLKTDPRTLRAFLRGRNQGAGRGQRYAWASMTDPAVKAIVRDWDAAQKALAAGSSDGARDASKTRTDDAKPVSKAA